MPRFMIDDPTRANPLSLLNTSRMAAITDIVSPRTDYLTVTGESGILVYEDVVLSVGDAVFKTERTTLSTSNLDTGTAFQVGSDYYVYICDNGSDTEAFRISLNTTFPAGFNADSSRKIGGFHFGQCRRHNAITLQPINTAGVERGTGWESNVYSGILPRSVWTMMHRPKCSPEGMVYLTSGIWVDIYLSSPNGAGGLRSAFNELPATGTEGHHWYNFAELLLGSNKRMMTYAEFCECALGAPQGADGNNTNAWAQTTNTARQRTGFVGPAVSSFGCRDTTGNVYEWVDELVTRYDASGANAIQSSWTWHDVFPGYGRAHMNSPNQLVALLAGGAWNVGVAAGPRSVHANLRPWYAGAGSGVRGACESL